MPAGTEFSIASLNACSNFNRSSDCRRCRRSSASRSSLELQLQQEGIILIIFSKENFKFLRCAGHGVTVGQASSLLPIRLVSCLPMSSLSDKLAACLTDDRLEACPTAAFGRAK